MQRKKKINETFLVENHSGNSSKKIILIIIIREKNNIHLVKMWCYNIFSYDGNINDENFVFFVFFNNLSFIWPRNKNGCSRIMSYWSFKWGPACLESQHSILLLLSGLKHWPPASVTNIQDILVDFISMLFCKIFLWWKKWK